MSTKLTYLFFSFLLISQYAIGQTNISWWNPAQNEFNVIDAQAWPNEVKSDYDRFPERAKKEVRESVWRLSKNSTGIKIRFRTNSSQIKVRYKVSGEMAMSHMPATGVSGVDLYAKNSDGKWLWCHGNYSFADTVTYNFTNITPNDKYHKLGREYHLYLPLYNSVEWLEIGCEEGALFEPIPVRKEKPIVVYGTSIAQGGCASRPGMAWTNILERKMDRPLINLGFSGNGELEPEVINLINEINAKIYILDCLPNLSLGEIFTAEEVTKRIKQSVKSLRKESNIPLLLVEHAGYGDATSNTNLFENTKRLNQIMEEAYSQLKSQGTKNLYLLTQEELGLGFEDFVDGTHPTDLGMTKYAKAYENKLRVILKEPVGLFSTTKPVTQSREPEMYNWEVRHNNLLEMNTNHPPKICFFGNSITHYWGGEPRSLHRNGSDSWNKYLGDLQVHNFGFGWDRVENVLWRIYHGQLDGFKADRIVLALGTNNLQLNTDKEIIEGLDLVIQAVKNRQPDAIITFIGIYPRRKNEERISELNLKISQLTGMQNVDFINIGDVLLNDDGKINESLFLDGLHPNSEGYNKLAPQIRNQLTKESIYITK
jgi:lysophospholipase L1-like esterase